MNEFDQTEISRNRAQRSNRALRNLSVGAGAVVVVSMILNILSPALAALYATGLIAMAIVAQLNLRKIQSAADQE